MCGWQEELAASVAEQQAAALAAGLLEAKKDSVTDDSVIGPSMPEPEPVHTEVLNFLPNCLENLINSPFYVLYTNLTHSSH